MAKIDEMKDLSVRLSAIDTIKAQEISNLLSVAVSQWRVDPILIKIAQKMLA